nr:AraC family transcriptional regulator [uncultured Eisenbergiella sp.]
MPIIFRSTPVSEPLTFDSIGNHWNQESVRRPKGYPLYHYLQTETGCGQIEIQGKIYLLNEGEGVLTAPFVRHSYSGKTEEWIRLFASFTGTIESSIAKILGNRQIVFIDKDQGGKIASLIVSIMKKYENPPADAKALSLDCYGLLLHFVDGVYTRDLMEDPLYQRYVAPVIKEIETNYDSELTVKGLSGTVYITPQYLSRLFGRFLGCSAYEYLTTYRINKAKEFLLTDPRMEVQKIALRVGFLDTSHFIAMFKKVTGLTPLEFRKLN